MGCLHIFCPETRTVTNLFWNTNLKIAYKATNTIKHHLKPRGEPRDINNQSGVHQLQCSECSHKYIGRRGCTFKVHYRECINTIRTNKHNSRFAQRILETGHTVIQ
jgi:hypothetical protein